ncbi:MAG: YiiX/YebB-like N1pC/P60 family cysteine hydrolase [bacterium]
MNIKTYQYAHVRSQIKNGDVLMYKGKGLISFLITKITGSAYSHAGIAVWWNKRLMVMEAVGKGVIVTPLSHNVEHYKGDVEWFWCKEQISDEHRIKMVQFAQEELGKSYAKWKLIIFGLFILLKKDMDKRDELRRANKLFCSYYVAQIYNSIGLDLKKNKSDRFMTPDDISKSPLLIKKAVLKREQ